MLRDLRQLEAPADVAGLPTLEDIGVKELLVSYRKHCIPIELEFSMCNNVTYSHYAVSKDFQTKVPNQKMRQCSA